MLESMRARLDDGRATEGGSSKTIQVYVARLRKVLGPDALEKPTLASAGVGRGVR
jgi:hypothetical protein